MSRAKSRPRPAARKVARTKGAAKPETAAPAKAIGDTDSAAGIAGHSTAKPADRARFGDTAQQASPNTAPRAAASPVSNSGRDEAIAALDAVLREGADLLAHAGRRGREPGGASDAEYVELCATEILRRARDVQQIVKEIRSAPAGGARGTPASPAPAPDAREIHDSVAHARRAVSEIVALTARSFAFGTHSYSAPLTKRERAEILRDERQELIDAACRALDELEAIEVAAEPAKAGA